MNDTFPDIIRQLPKACIPLDGLRIHISHSDTHEVWFLESDVEIDYPVHAHAAQFGCVLKGQISITMNDETRSYRKGDTYFIPEGVPHTVLINPGYAEVIFLNDPDFLSK